MMRKAAADSVGLQRGLDAAKMGIQTLLQAIEALRPIRAQLESQILQLAERIPAYLTTLPGCNALAAVSLFAETDPITAFKAPEQLVAFAGRDVTVWQSGQILSSRHGISKRGSPHLRYTLWQIANQARLHDGYFRDFYQRKRTAGKHHLSALTATAAKVCRVGWRLMTDQRDYQPTCSAPKT